nr:hypothetical protein [uncultured Azospirillum sp.]
MRTALHPSENRFINVEDYIADFGHRIADRGAADDVLRARCPFCPSRLSHRAAIPDRVAHFCHPEGAECPSMAPAGQPYIDLTPTDPDPEAERAIKRAFRHNWQRHVRRMEQIVPCLHFKEVLALLDFATERRMWGHRGLREEDLPYVLILSADFPPDTGTRKEGRPERRFWFRYWFSHQIRNLAQLWIEPPENVTLFRALYEPPPRRPRPDLTDLFRIDVIDRTTEFLGQEPRALPGWYAEKIEAWFRRHPSFN